MAEALPELHGSGVALRALAPEHAEGLRAIRREREVADWWGPLEDDFPLDDEPTARRYAILVEEELAGMIQFSEEEEPDYRHAEVDVFLDPARRGQGLGTEAMRTLLAYLTGERGHHRVILGTAIDNQAARCSYEKAGFQRVGVTRRSGRDYRSGEFGDEWFLEYVVSPGGSEARERVNVLSATDLRISETASRFEGRDHGRAPRSSGPTIRPAPASAFTTIPTRRRSWSRRALPRSPSTASRSRRARDRSSSCRPARCTGS